jgi:hypothetical protein
MLFYNEKQMKKATLPYNETTFWDFFSAKIKKTGKKSHFFSFLCNFAPVKFNNTN